MNDNQVKLCPQSLQRCYQSACETHCYRDGVKISKGLSRLARIGLGVIIAAFVFFAVSLEGCAL